MCYKDAAPLRYDAPRSTIKLLPLDMNRRSLKFALPLLLLIWLFAQNGMAMLQLLTQISGHPLTTSWHNGHYDLSPAHEHALAETETAVTDSCASSCSHHIDIKPLEAATDLKSKSLLIALPALLPALLCWLLPLPAANQARPSPLSPHRNTLPLLIRSTVLRH